MPTQTFHDDTINIGHSSLHCRSWGTAGDLPDLLVEHGGGGSTNDWSLIGPLLGEHTRVFSYDRAGSGTSPRDDLGRGAVANTQRLSKLIEKLPIRKPFILVGYSLGGLYARHYAAQYPDQVAGVVLLDATPTKHTFKQSDFNRAIRTMYLVHFAARSGLGTLFWYLGGIKMERERFKEYVARIGSPKFVPNVREELNAITTVQSEVSNSAEKPTHPTLALIAGTGRSEKDAAQLAEIRILHDKLMSDAPPPLSRQTVIEGANHGTLVSEQKYAEAVAGQILLFVRSLAAR